MMFSEKNSNSEFINIFCEIMSYEGTKSTGKIKETIGLKEDISQRNIIIIEDVIDRGNTLVEILKTLEKYDISSVSIVITIKT